MNGQNMPPADVSPTELFSRLIERPQPSEIVDFPAKLPSGVAFAKIRIVVLPMEKHDEARLRARTFLKTKKNLSDSDLSSPLGVELMGDAVARELLAMSCRLVDPIPGTGEDDVRPEYPLLFRNSADVNKLTADEVTALFGAYLLVQKRFGPYDHELDENEVNAWIERLVVGASSVPLGQLPSHQLAGLCLSLAQRAFTLSQLLNSQRESLPFSWESIPESWAFGTSSSSEPAASDTPSSDDGTITREQAMAAAKTMIGR